MKDTISDWDLLIIRGIKHKNLYSDIIKRIKSVISRRNLITKSQITNHDLSYILLDICISYDLIRDLHEFIYKDLNPKKWWTNEIKSYDDNLIHELINIIGCSPVNKFPRYPRSTFFKNKYPDYEEQ